MSIKTDKIKLTGKDVNIQIPISTNLDFTGYQQEIDKYTQIQTADSVNEATDGEVVRFRLKNPTSKLIDFGFAFTLITSTAWASNFTIAGFTHEEITGLSSNYLNSFFILDFFDTYQSADQTKIFSTYLTKLYSNNEDDNRNKSTYKFDIPFQLESLFVPLGYLNLEEGVTTYTAYCRFSFYDAKSGRTSVFFNKDNETLTTNEKMYFRVDLDLINKTWNFITPSFETSGTAYARELASSPAYIEKYNNTFENYDNLQENYPSGNTFVYSEASYTTNA